MHKIIISIFFLIFSFKSIAAPTIVYCNGNSNYKVNEALNKNKSLSIEPKTYILIFNTNHTFYIELQNQKTKKQVFKTDSLIKVLEKNNTCNPILLNQSLNEIIEFKTLIDTDLQITTKPNTWRCGFALYSFVPNKNAIPIYGNTIFMQWALNPNILPSDTIGIKYKVLVLSEFDEIQEEIITKNKYVIYTKNKSNKDINLVVKPSILNNNHSDCMDNIDALVVNSDTSEIISKEININSIDSKKAFSKYLKIKILQNHKCFIDANYEWQLLIKTNSFTNAKLGYRKFLLDNGAVAKPTIDNNKILTDSDILIY